LLKGSFIKQKIEGVDTYQITDLVRLTGVKAHTIRIWEKRYGIIVPHRTATNIRFYDNDQMKRLINVSTLLGQGFKISKIAALTNDELLSRVEQKFKEGVNESSYMIYINDLIASMLTIDEEQFNQTFDVVIKKYGVYTTMIHIIYPFMVKVGYMWTINKLSSYQEHFASAIVRKKLLVETNALTLKHSSAKTFVLFLPPDEWHEIALLFANYIIKSKGHKTIYLGQNVPYDDVFEVLNNFTVDYTLSFYILSNSEKDAQSNFTNYVKKFPATKFLMAGNKTFLQDLKLPSKRVSFIDSPVKLISFL
jgi:MerR family transcriptional regulator, light-induced transcriptional regulator